VVAAAGAYRLMIGDLVQVRRYFTEPGLRKKIRQRVADVVEHDTTVIVGHSLGSVVAYEVICAHPDWPIRALVTLGSPLGIRNLSLDRLEPAPLPARGQSDELTGSWPGSAEAWTNIADEGDIVALVKDLRPRFVPRVTSWLVHNGAHAHDIAPYLSTREAGAAILAGLVWAAISDED